MQLPPADVLASWPTPNYVDPVARGPANLIMNVILYPLVCLAIFLRLFTRLRISKSFGVDDWLILASLVCAFLRPSHCHECSRLQIPTTAFTAISFMAEMHFGWNRHVWDVEIVNIILGLKLVITSAILFSVATTLTKCSMLTLMYRIIEPSSRRFGRIIIGAIVIVAAESVIFVFLVLLQCR